MSDAERAAALAAAGNNVFRIPAHHVPFDLFSDVATSCMVPRDEIARDADPDELRAAIAPLAGEHHVAFGTKGRAVEQALVEALDVQPGAVVLAHGLFATTQAALGRRGTVLEDVPLAQPTGFADVDPDAVAARLAAGGVRLVYLELANNAVYGWPITSETMMKIREHCDRHDALLVVDAARPLANAAALDEPDLVAHARRVLSFAHAFTMSCAKEMLVPVGAVVGARDPAIAARVSQLVFSNGTSMAPVEPPGPRVDLRDGIRYTLGAPHIVRERLARVRELAAALAARAIAIAEPVTAHAVYVPIDRALVPAGDIPAMIALLGQLFVVAGVRAQVANGKRGPAIRLALPLATPVDAAAIAAGLAACFERIAERPVLRFLDGQLEAPYFRPLVRA